MRLACPPVGRTRPVASWRARPRDRELFLLELAPRESSPEAIRPHHDRPRCLHLLCVDVCQSNIGGVGPAPCVGEGVELRLAYLPARLAKENVVIRVRIKRRIE